MIVEFRVLAVSKEDRNYFTDLLRGVFEIEHPILDTVDTLPVTSTINVISSCGWKALSKEAITSENYIFVPFVGHTISE